MRNFGTWAAAAIAVLLFMAYGLYPPGESLRLGKDLRGGVTLMYSVQIERGENAEQVIDQTIQILKQRVDPTGLLEIQMVRQGADRIEVTMPLPSDESLALRRAYEEKLRAIGDLSIEPAELERVMRLPDAERQPALERLAGGNAERLELLRGAATSLDRALELRALYEQTESLGAPDEELDRLAQLAAEADVAYESARDAVLAASLDPERLRATLGRSGSPKFVLDENDERFELPSPREQGLTQLREEFPELVDRIDEAAAAYETYLANRSGLDDPEDLKRLLSGAGVLSFRITIDPQGGDTANVHPEEDRLRRELREVGPRNVRARDARWFRINRIENWYNSLAEYRALEANPVAFFAGRGYVVEPYDGAYYMLAWDVPGMRLTPDDGRWSVANAFRTADQLGRPAIGFQMDARGATLLGELTGANVTNQMAVLLDDQVYTAPNLRARISSNGVIEGDFPPDEISYIIQTLTAGSLQARLSPEPISENRIAPELGQDNLQTGLRAGLIALAIVSVFMVFYYFGYGLVAVFSLLCNALCILGAMALASASFTLPGIAGVILTFGMAVDANVLIFERIREELREGQKMRVAVRLGYERALSSIVDGNVTNLIVCFVLGTVGTQEVRGFAITLGIGVVSTMFSALVISRVIFALLTDHVKVGRMRMLPMAIPLIERVLEPKIDWIGKRDLFILISLAGVALGVGMILFQNTKMLDTEFRGGTEVTLTFKPVDEADVDGPRMTSTRAEVEERVRSIAEGLDETDPLLALRNAEVIPVNPQGDGVTSDQFRIKTTATQAELVLGELVNAFTDLVDAQPALEFRASDVIDASAAPAFPVLDTRLGDVIGRPEVRDDVGGYLGGLAIVLEGLEPSPTRQQIVDRLNQLRGKPDFSDTLSRRHDVLVIDGTSDSVRSAVILVSDEAIGFLENQNVWRSEVRDREWTLAREALAQPIILASVQNFSPVIADEFRQQAVVAVLISFLLILIYIWVRFGSVRYSAAAIVTLCHDVLIAIGLIALAEIIYEAHFLENFAASIGIRPFKIDLNLVAAILTIIGYSLNDTIIIMDRIRENRGRLPYASREVVNRSINQTISRTVITSGTTFLAVLILYAFGGEGVRAFSYALLIGVVVGTYSSIAVAAPLVWSAKRDKSGTHGGPGEPPVQPPAGASDTAGS